LLILRDILCWVSEFSLAAQTVNTLPWELREKELALYHRLESIVQPTSRTCSAPPILSCRTVQPFTMSSRLAASRAWSCCHLIVDDDPTEHEYTLAEQTKLLIDEAGDYADAAHNFMDLRVVQGKAAPRQGENGGFIATVSGAAQAYRLIEELGKCFDLRGLCVEPCVLAEREPALKRVLAWAARTGVVFDVRGGRGALSEQLETLRQRLVAAAKVLPYRTNWFNAEGVVHSGTVIMKDLILVLELNADAGDILYLFQHAVLKGRNEAVIEGMGSMVSLHADKTRGRLGFDQYSAEAIFHYNFPPLSHPSARVIIVEVLTDHFGKDKDGNPKPWHFTPTSAIGQASKYNERSAVLRRLDAVVPRHAFMAV
jgi:hypothetical protein